MNAIVPPPADASAKTVDVQGAKLVDVQGVAGMCTCSTRHVYRLADAGKMPAPLKLGSLVRWSRAAIEEWIAAGCPSCRKGGRR